MVPFKAGSRLKQYNPQKPKKLGYKLCVLTSPEGQICNFEVYTGAIEMFPGLRDLQASGNIVMHLFHEIIGTDYLSTIGIPAYLLAYYHTS